MTKAASDKAARELPPLARGRPVARIGRDRREGATPARAGPTERDDAEIGRPKSYPRSRGADFHLNPISVNTTELPPLARGRLLVRRRGGDG